MSSKPPILFLHGAFAGPETWQKFLAPWFAARGHRVLAPDLAGPASGPVRLRDYISRACDAADALGGRPVVVGHSLGGFVAQHLAARQKASGMALLASPGPFGLGPTFWNLSSRSPEVLAAALAIQAGAADLLSIDLMRMALFAPDTPDGWIIDVLPEPRQESPRVLLDAMTWHLPAWPLARLTPTLALHGRLDAFVPTTDFWSLGFAYNAEMEAFSGMGHGLPLDPNWRSLAWRINAWLDERRVGQATSAPLAA